MVTAKLKTKTKDVLRNCTLCGVRGRFGLRFADLPDNHPDQKTQPRCGPCRNKENPAKFDGMNRAQLQREVKTRLPGTNVNQTNFDLVLLLRKSVK